MDDIAKKRFAELFDKTSWDRNFEGLELLEVAQGKAKLRLPVGPRVMNLGGKLHGGAIATLVDDAGTIAIISADRDSRPGVSTDLNVSFFAPGEGVVIAEAAVLKIGRTLAFVTVDIRREKDNVLVAQGRMTKHLG
jgi:acyl-coenzyme A thioesterase 13